MYGKKTGGNWTLFEFSKHGLYFKKCTFYPIRKKNWGNIPDKKRWHKVSIWMCPELDGHPVAARGER